MSFFKSFELTEESFINDFIDAVFAQDQREMSKLCNLAVQSFGEKQASALANNCYQSVKLADPELGIWLDSWFRKYKYSDR
jgi:hypothetical protein